MDVTGIMQVITNTVTQVGLRVVGALVLWIVGRTLISMAVRLVSRALAIRHIDATITRYLANILTVVLNIVLVVAILGFFGVETTTFAALVAAAGVAIGIAWGGLLGSFAAGAFLIILQPFKTGDFVTVGGMTGTVVEIGLFATTINTPDNVQDHRRQQQGLRRHHPELLGESVPARGPRRPSSTTGLIIATPSPA